jgi:hypothetical protein
MHEGTLIRSTARDFDFWLGRWYGRNWRLRERLAGCDEWDEFESISVARRLPGGMGNQDEFRTDYGGGYVGMSIRFFDSKREQWSIYWADSRTCGTLDPPVVGTFMGDTGIFEGPDTFEGRPILVRYTWSQVSSGTPRWEQAFSEDGGETWETNFVSEFRRVEEDE